MKTSNSPEGGIEPQVADFINALLDRAAALRLPELCAGKHAGALWWVPSRHGVTVVALRTTSLSEEQRVKIMTYRLAQYVMARELDPRMIYDARLEHEPLSNVSEADIHFIGCCSATGEILCYITLEAIVDVGYKTLSSDERRLFPVETVFGPGVFRRLRILPDLPVAGLLLRRPLHSFALTFAHRRLRLFALTRRSLALSS